MANRSSNGAARWLWHLLVLDPVAALGRQSDATAAFAGTSVLGRRGPRLIRAVGKAVRGASPQRRRAALGILLFTAASLAAGQTETASAEGVRRFGPPRQAVLVRALGLATEKLRRSECRQLFSEFQDLEGRRLDEILASRGDSLEEHLRRMRFAGDSQDGSCRRSGILAFTSPGSLDVSLCSSFLQVARRDIALAANLLIHEELHSLGAGEAPAPGQPTNLEITARVASRCGR